MRRSLRFYFALFFAKGDCYGPEADRQKGDVYARILGDHPLSRFSRAHAPPKTVVGITGTNGKTTVANMVEEAYWRIAATTSSATVPAPM